MIPSQGRMSLLVC